MNPRRLWIPPLLLLLLTGCIWLFVRFADPRLLAIRYITAGSPPRNYVLGIRTLDLFPGLFASLQVEGYPAHDLEGGE